MQFLKTGRRGLLRSSYSSSARLSRKMGLRLEPLEDRRLMVVRVVNSVEDDGSIPAANDTGLLSGDQADIVADIGDGPFGDTTGDYDHFKVHIFRNQRMTAEITADRSGSTLDSVLAVYNSQGTLVDFNDDFFFFDSFIDYVAPVTDDYYVVVAAFNAGLQRDPFDSSSGRGSITSAGPYALNITLAARTPVPPVANNDTFGTPEDTPVVMDVLFNDVDSDGALDPASVRISTPPTNGTAAVDINTGEIRYVPRNNFSGVDTMRYTVRDDENNISNIATITINVTNVNDPPFAGDDLFSVFKNTPQIIDIFANDRDTDGTIVRSSLAIVTPPTNGTLSVSAANVVTYSPNLNYLGPDSFTYRVNDNSGATSNLATVTIGVVPKPPVAGDDQVTTAEDTSTTINVLANDVDTDGTIVVSSVSFVTQPQHGSISVSATGVVTYVPTLNYNGPDKFTYQVRDNDNALSNIATVSITVTPVNDAPVAVNDLANTNESQPVDINVLANDNDVDSNLNPASIALIQSPSGTATVDPITGIVTFTPGAGFSGTATFSYNVKDVEGLTSNTAVVTVSVNALPKAVDDAVITDEDTPIAIIVAANDSDSDGTVVPTTVVITTDPTNGVATVDAATGVVTYVPNLNFFGTDTFQYTIRDNKDALSAPGTVTITVKPINDSPVAVDDAISTQVNTPVVIDILANDFDVDGTIDPTTVIIVDPPDSGTLFVNPVTGAVTYTPNPGLEDADFFSYTVKDNLGAVSNVAKVSIRVGDPVSVSGVVYVDANNNGVKDGNEVGIADVAVSLAKTNGNLQFTLTTLTGPDGSFSFIEDFQNGVILPSGVYTLTETHPAFFIDGKDTPGTPPPSGPATNDAFVDIILPQGTNATGYAFGERGLRAEFIAAFINRRAFFASADPNATIDLSQGAAFFSFDGGFSGSLFASAQYDAGEGTVSFELLDNSLNVIASSSDPNSAQLQYEGIPGQNMFLKVTGTNANVWVTTEVMPLLIPWRNLASPLDVDGSGAITAADALMVIDTLNIQGSRQLSATQSPTAVRTYFDVNGDGMVSPIDALMVINQLNSGARSALPSQSLSAVAAPASQLAAAVALNQAGDDQSDLAFAVASEASASGTASAQPATATLSPQPAAGSAWEWMDSDVDDLVLEAQFEELFS